MEPQLTEHRLIDGILIGLVTMVTTPLLAGLMHHALMVNGSAVDDESATASGEINTEGK